MAFGNKAQQGKDSAAAVIKEYAALNGLPEVRIFKFAEALYSECRELHGMTEKDAPLLQRVGSERRAKDKDYWVKQVAKQLKSFDGIALITDLRYFNEALFIKESRGFLVNVQRLNGDGKPFIAPDRPADHPSEIELDNYPWDYFIKTHTGEEALAAEQALTLFNYLLEITAQ